MFLIGLICFYDLIVLYRINICKKLYIRQDDLDSFGYHFEQHVVWIARCVSSERRSSAT